MNSSTELIVINDGSTDSTKLLLEKYQNISKDLTVIHKQNGGPASTRNLGIDIAKGEYLVFLDADDKLCENAIAVIFNFLNTNQRYDFIIGGHYSIHPSGKQKLHLPKSLPAERFQRLKSYLLDKTISISNGACLMHRSIFETYRYPEHFRNSEDIPIFAYTLVNFNCTTIQKPLANIYKHNDSLRHNIAYAETIGSQLVEEVFNIKRIPAELQSLKKPFLVQRLLSLSRTCHESHHHEKCSSFFMQAFKLNMSVIFKWSYFKKFIISSFYQHVKTPIST